MRISHCNLARCRHQQASEHQGYQRRRSVQHQGKRTQRRCERPRHNWEHLQGSVGIEGSRRVSQRTSTRYAHWLMVWQWGLRRLRHLYGIALQRWVSRLLSDHQDPNCIREYQGSVEVLYGRVVSLTNANRPKLMHANIDKWPNSKLISIKWPQMQKSTMSRDLKCMKMQLKSR